MNFNVTDAVNSVAPAQQPTPIVPQKETPVQRQMRLNQEAGGLRVVRPDPNANRMMTSVESDIKETVKELPNTLADMQNFGSRMLASRTRLGLGNGGFPSQMIQTMNFQTRTLEPPIWMESSRINAEFVAREPMMSDDELDEFFMKYYVEYDPQTGNPLPKKYPNGRLVQPPIPGSPSAGIPVNQQGQTNTAGPVNYQQQPQSTGPLVYPVEPYSTTGYIQEVPGSFVPNPDHPINQQLLQQEQAGYSLPPEQEAQKRQQIQQPVQMAGTTEHEAQGIRVKYKLEEKPVNVNRKKLDQNKLKELTEMTLDRNAVSCTAVASRYKCDITPVTYREFDQIRSMVETSKLARETKLWSLIYRHVKNPTIGQFKSFQDFCEKTAFVDRRRFWFAMMCGMTKDVEKVDLICISQRFKVIPVDGINYDISSYSEAYQEIDAVSLLPTRIADIPDLRVYTILTIGDMIYKYIPLPIETGSDFVRWVEVEQLQRCGAEYQHEYINRSLMDPASDIKWVQEEIDKINSIGSISEAVEYHTAGPLMSKRVLPINEFISLEVGIKSVADVLRNDYKYVLDDELFETIKKEAAKDLKDLYGQSHEPTEEEVQEYLQNEVPDSTMIPVMGMSVIDKAIAIIDGEETETNIDAEIISILKNNCSPVDIAPLYNGDANNNLIYRYMTSYEPSFSYKDCTCPVCGEKSNTPIETIEDLVFTLSRSTLTTSFDITDI